MKIEEIEQVLYRESNAVAIIRPSAGVVYTLPVVLDHSSNDYYVKYRNAYIQPEQISGFERIEILPSRSKARPESHPESRSESEQS